MHGGRLSCALHLGQLHSRRNGCTVRSSHVALLERIMFSVWVNQYGLVALGLLIFLESAGLPLPGETILLLAAAAQGVLPIGAVIVVAAGAAVVGDSLGYWIGQRYGLALLTRYGRWLRITPAHLDHAQAFFQR